MSLTTFLTETDVLVLTTPGSGNKELLEQLVLFGYRPISCPTLADLKASVEALPHGQTSAILIDGQPDVLPLVAEVCKLASQSLAHLKTILLAANLSVEDQIPFVRAGVSAFVHQPTDTSTLVNRLDKLLRIEETKPYRVLIVDDSRAMSSMHQYVLKNAGMVTEVLNEPLKILDCIEEFSPDLILMDMYMPECSGDELAMIIRQREQFTGVPIVYLSVENNLDRQLVARKMGGDDFLTKPVQPDNLVMAVSITAERYRQLSKMLSQDAMTGLLNHNRLEEQLIREMNRSRREISPLSFAIIDIDFFKKVNDTYGHGAGDRVIKSLSQLLLQRLRNTDYIGRMGGEEFGIIFPNTPIAEIERILNELRESFASLRFQTDGAEFSCTFSAGAAAFLPGVTPQALSSMADQALYTSKQNGRNRVTIASPG